MPPMKETFADTERTIEATVCPVVQIRNTKGREKLSPLCLTMAT